MPKSPYSAGRPLRFRADPDELSDIPQLPGEYRMYTAVGVSKYVGEATKLRRRISQHLRTKKIRAGQYVDYIIADGRSTSTTRRIHETQFIEKKQPKANKRAGGGGRKANRRATSTTCSADPS